jgi:mannitol/fructose-specific phosphotransferase system IIA component
VAINFRRILNAGSMRFELETRALPPASADDEEEPPDPLGDKNLDRVREQVIAELADLLDASGAVSNRNRLFTDLFNREKKACTAIGDGIAIPHVRTIQARRFIMAFARSGEGLPFRAPDDEPVYLFFAMVSPPYEDRMYLRV